MEKMTTKLLKMGFSIKPYDDCAANKSVNGSTCSVVWHVDDLKISHKDHDVVIGIIEQINKVFGKESPVTVLEAAFTII
jgi:hypothetical protein